MCTIGIQIQCNDRNACFFSLCYTVRQSRTVAALNDDRVIFLIDDLGHDLHLLCRGTVAVKGLYCDIIIILAFTFNTFQPCLIVRCADIMCHIGNFHIFHIGILCRLAAYRSGFFSCSCLFSRCRCFLFFTAYFLCAAAGNKKSAHNQCQPEC